MPDEAREGPAAGNNPIGALGALEESGRPDFFERIRKRIWRRETVSEVASFSWHTPGPVMMELGSLLLHVLRASSGKGGRGR